MKTRTPTAVLLILDLLACGTQSGDRPAPATTAETRQEVKSTEPVAKSSSFTDQLREISRRLGSDLSPLTMGVVLHANFRPAGDGFWSAELNHDSMVLVKAERVEAPVTWIKFRVSQAFGLALRDVESLYGTRHRILEGQKDGTDVHFSPGQALLVAPETYVGARLWARQAAPDAAVTQLTLSVQDRQVTRDHAQ